MQIFCLLIAPVSFGFLSLASLSLHALKHQQRPPPFSYFGLISMHLFHSSCLLLSCILESIQGEELIDLRGIMSATNQRPGAGFRSCGGF